MKLKPQDYLGIFLEIVPCGIPFALDLKKSREIRNDAKYTIDTTNSEKTKNVAIATEQQLKLDNYYKTFGGIFDGVLTHRAKQEIYSVLNRLRDKKEKEIMRKPYSTLVKTEENEDGISAGVIPKQEIVTRA